MLLHPFKVKTRKGKIIENCYLQGIDSQFPLLVIPHPDFGHITREVSWETLLNCMTNHKPVIL